MLNSNKWIFALIICFTIIKNSSGLPSNSSLRGLGDECSTDSDCASINGLCSKKKCVCKPSYNFLYGKCTAAPGAHCKEPSDCNIENVFCSDNKCLCPENMHLARNKTSCIKTAIALGDFCEQAEDCQKVEHSYCSTSSKCECVDNYFEQNKQCVKGIGADCTQDSECKVIDSECTQNKCHCLENMHLANNRSHCIRNATAVFDFCEQEEDCSAIMHTNCLNNKCECKDPYFASNDKCVAELGTPCNKPTDCNIENVSCSGNKCYCPKDMHLAVNKTSCIRNATAPLDFCENDEDCSSIMHTSCIDDKCKCKDDQYFADSGKCVARPGAPCNDATDCNIENASCLGNKCSCPENMHLAVNETSCIRNAAVPFDFCEQDEDCSSVMHSTCLDNRCKCKNYYSPTNKKCIAELGAPCNKPTDCNIENVSCSDRKCLCPENMHLARNKSSCIKNAFAPLDFCEKNEDCDFVEHSKCVKEKCLCNYFYFPRKGKCVTKLEAILAGIWDIIKGY